MNKIKWIINKIKSVCGYEWLCKVMCGMNRDMMMIQCLIPFNDGYDDGFDDG